MGFMRPAIPRWFIVVFFLTFSSSPVEAAPRWNYFSSLELEVVGPVSEDAALEMAQRLALFRQLFLKTLGISRNSGSPLRVYLFEGDRELQPFLPLKDGKPLQSSGFFHRDLDRETLVLHLGTGTRQTSEVAFHLYAHLLSGPLTEWPAWWREGLAEFLSTAEFGTNKVRLGQAPERHLAYFRTHPPLPLAELLGVDRNSLSYDEGTKSGPFYATSWLLVHKLLVKSGLRHLVGASEFHRLLSSGNDAQQALVKAFQVDAAGLEAELKQTGRQFVFSAMQVDLEAPWDAQKTSTTQPSPPEVQAYLGDLLYRSLREIDAEDSFNKAIALDPQLPLAYEGLGWLRIHQNRRGEAVEYFKQANQYGSKNALSHYHHAEKLLQDLSKDAENAALADLARRELEVAVQLRPNFAAGHYSLAHLSLMLGRAFEEGIPHAEAAIRLEPGNPQYVLALVGLLFYAKRFSEARAVLEPLLTAATDNGYKSTAEAMRDMIEESISRKRSLEDLVNPSRPPQPKEP
jgi:tetratricopeptide (TPR) repeat protein